ncbi:Integrase core domain protein, partial [Candidatus Arcanobacter lacustris]
MQKASKHLTLEERCHIFILKERGFSLRDISRTLSRNVSSISRELKRNSILNKYTPRIAEEQYHRRMTNVYSGPRKMTSSLKEIICSKLKILWSPEQISGRLKIENGIKISHEAIYQLIWRDKKQGGDLYKNLRHAGKKYNKRRGKNAGRGIIPGRVDIELRDKIVEEKSRIGDWEGDTVIGANHKGAIVTLVDRKSKFSLFTLVAEKTKDLVTQAIEKSLNPHKIHVKTITFDNGREFAGHQKIAQSLDAECFFAKPYHSWERGLNEHTNGLLRQYIPKKSDFTLISQEDVDFVQNALNNRPRKVLNYKTPTEVFRQNHTVAFA